MEGATGTVDGFDSFVVSGGRARADLALLYQKEISGMFLNVCVTEMGSSGAADVIDNVAEVVIFESV